MVENNLLQHSTYDVTSTCLKYLCLGSASSILTLEEEEVSLHTKTCFSNENKRLPYGELGSVEHQVSCICCHSFNSNLSGQNEKGAKVPIQPGCGCQGSLVTEIVEELKSRMKGRGDTGNIQRAEEALLLLKHMVDKTERLMQKMGLRLPSGRPQETDEHHVTAFEHKDYEVTNAIPKIFCCATERLNLESEEVQVVSVTCCTKANKRLPYGQLQDVQVDTSCGCFACLTTSMGPMAPGCGCDKALVTEIADELKKRMKDRGDTGNIRRQEVVNEYARYQDKLITEMMRGQNVPEPAMPPQLQQMMKGDASNRLPRSW